MDLGAHVSEACNPEKVKEDAARLQSMGRGMRFSAYTEAEAWYTRVTFNLTALCKLVIARRKSPLDTFARVSRAPSAKSTSSSATQRGSSSQQCPHSQRPDVYSILCALCAESDSKTP